MKKLVSILLTAVMLCTLLAVFTVPALAAEYSCSTWDDVAYAIENGGSDVNIILENNIYSIYEIDINRPCTIDIRGRSKAREYIITDYYENNTRLFTISSDDVRLNLNDLSVNDFKANLEKGGVIYVTGEDCVIDGGNFTECAAKRGGAIYLEDGSSTTIKNAYFAYNWNSDEGSAIYANDDAVIDHCTFEHNISYYAGGAIYDNNDYGEVRITWCSFDGNQAIDIKTGKEGLGMWVYGGGDAVVDYCTFSGGDTEYYYYDCESVTNSVGSTEPQEFIRPEVSQYAKTAMANNEYCDIIRRDEYQPVQSDKGYFTVTADASDVFGWRAKADSPLTITAEDGYIITAIEGHIPAHEFNGARDFEYLIADNGTKSVDEAYVDMFGRARSDIDVWIRIDDINSDSLTLTTEENKFEAYTMNFDEFIVYYEESAILGSVFSGGTLWIIIGVTAVAIATTVVIVKKKKSNTK